MLSWKILQTEADLQSLLSRSEQVPVGIFKHSTRCGISFEAKERLQVDWDLDEALEMYYLDLLQYRLLSNRISELLGILHQSPQFILIHKGQAVFHNSHHAISLGSIHAALERLQGQ